MTLQACSTSSFNTFSDFLNGQASLEFAGLASGSTVSKMYFYGDNMTSGRVIARVNAKSEWCGSLPNLSEIEVAGQGIVYVNLPSNENMNPNVEFNIHDLNGGYISIKTGLLNVPVARVMCDGIDWPAGTYNKNGVAWLAEGAGSCTIPDHVYRWVWAGKGADNSMSTAANWATNVAPGEAEHDVLLDFSRIAPSASVTVDAAVSVDGLTSGTNANSVLMDGNAILTITGADTHVASVTFTNSVSITHSGAGRQTFRGTAPSTLGVVKVENGTVAFADGFNLTEADKVDLAQSAILELGEGVHAKCRVLRLAGEVMGTGTYGSEASAATKKYAMFFAGTGVLECLSGRGTLVVLR